MGSFFAMSNISRSSNCPPQVEGQGNCGAPALLCRAPQGHSGLDGTSLKGHGQCHCFFSLHHSVVSGFLEFLWGKVVL